VERVSVSEADSTAADRTPPPWCCLVLRLLLSTAVVLACGLGPARVDGQPVSEAGWGERLRRAKEALEWTDEAVRHDWRLQRHAVRGTCRILDPADGLVRDGTPEQCRAAFEELERQGTLPAVQGDTIILLHGLGESRDSMQPLAEYLRRSLDATVLCFGYASVKADIHAHGRALGTVVADLPRAERLSFVGHSLGNLVVRRWMAMADEADLARTYRMVMLGPPNRGSELARMVSKVRVLANRAEGAGRDLVLNWQQVEPTLALPTCPFGIVAGGLGDDRGFSPLLEGDDDAVVRVEETMLPGAEDFLVLPVLHAAMMRHAEVQRATAEFLAGGRFPVEPRADRQAAAATAESP
jgi:pimeloyl-ACP methyl ester carboxylesterase